MRKSDHFDMPGEAYTSLNLFLQCLPIFAR